jgi:hypothetical protein
MPKRARKDSKSTEAAPGTAGAAPPLPRRDDNQLAFETLQRILRQSEPGNHPLALALTRLGSLKPGRGTTGDPQ